MSAFSEGDTRRDWRRFVELSDDLGRVLAAALARLIEAYESDPDRARHVLGWEHLPGRKSAIGPEQEKQIAKSEAEAQEHLRGSILHGGHQATLEYAHLLDDWYSICSEAAAPEFELDNFLDLKHNSHWRITGSRLIPSERELRFGWSSDDIELLRASDPATVSRYSNDLETLAHREGLRREDADLWVKSRLDDLPSAVEKKLLELREEEMHTGMRRLQSIEEARELNEWVGRFELWVSANESNPEIDLPSPEYTQKRFPIFCLQ